MNIGNGKFVIDNSIDNMLSNRFNVNASGNKFNEFLKALKDNITVINSGAEIFKDNNVYKMRISPEIMEGIKNGEFVEFRDSNKKFLGDFIDKKTGNVVGKARWEKEDFNQILNFAQMAQTMAVQAKLNDIFDYMEIIDDKLDSVIRGQHTDRIAYIKSGIKLFEDAFNGNNKSESLQDAKKSLIIGKNQLLGFLHDQSIIIAEKPKINGLMGKTKSFFVNTEEKWTKKFNDRFPMIKEAIEYSIIATKYISYINLELGIDTYNIEKDLISFQREIEQFANKIKPIVGYLEYNPEKPPEFFVNNLSEFSQLEISLNKYEEIDFEFKGEVLLNG